MVILKGLLVLKGIVYYLKDVMGKSILLVAEIGGALDVVERMNENDNVMMVIEWMGSLLVSAVVMLMKVQMCLTVEVLMLVMKLVVACLEYPTRRQVHLH